MNIAYTQTQKDNTIHHLRRFLYHIINRSYSCIVYFFTSSSSNSSTGKLLFSPQSRAELKSAINACLYNVGFFT